MLSRTHRLSREGFKKIRWTKSANSPFFALRGASSREKNFSVSVSKKVSKSAVARNTIRRRTYRVLGEEMETLPLGSFHLIARPSAEKLRGESLKKEINSLFAKLR